MDLLDLIEKELKAFRRTGRPLRLAHAARALDAVRSEAYRNSKSLHPYVDGHQTSGQ